MRIQHNIAALNSYRNYTNNTGAVSKNLEKLSSGYRINRAGDDAAGLAISEKMRAQITGLETAQKNASDGISLVQTAEGALTEVHSMLNRMVELADQSANGTYQNETDRTQLQKEVKALQDEIDRIADATNFNGINLLDGSLGGGTAGGTKGVPAIDGDGLGTLTEVAATAGSTAFTATDLVNLTAGNLKGSSLNYSFTVEQDGVMKTYDITLDVSEDGKELLFNGDKVGTIATNDGKATNAEQAKAIQAAFGKHSELKKMFTVAEAGGVLTFTNKVKGAGAATMKFMVAPDAAATGEKNSAGTVTAGVDAYQKGAPKSDEVFTVGGKKFAFASDADKAKAFGPDVTVVVQAGGTIAQQDLEKMAALIKQQTGYEPTVNTTNFEWKADPNGKGAAGEGLTLQIGDTSAEYNQLTVSVGDTHAQALGIAGVNIATQSGAKAAVDMIKTAINKVSDTRGTLGATQNRLEHTINNLSVTTENMTAAESRIRDVDVAKEMMSYTKNNILVQSAQAMLAQANQTPQGVLQLLQ